MKTITISEEEYLQLQRTIQELEEKLRLFQDKDFIQKLNVAYELFVHEKNRPFTQNSPSASLKRGSAKEIIRYMADDFNAPLEDFKDYM